MNVKSHLEFKPTETSVVIIEDLPFDRSEAVEQIAMQDRRLLDEDGGIKRIYELTDRMNPFHISRLLSEGHSGECNLVVFLRKRTRRYADEGNCQSVPPEWVEAGGEI